MRRFLSLWWTMLAFTVLASLARPQDAATFIEQDGRFLIDAVIFLSAEGELEP